MSSPRVPIRANQPRAAVRRRLRLMKLAVMTVRETICRSHCGDRRGSTWGVTRASTTRMASLRPTDRIAPRRSAVSNGVLDQGQSNPSPVGATTLGVFWGQLISHDLSLTPTGISDTLRVHGDEAQIEGKHYPFVAEKIELLLEHVFYESTNNVIHRAIYLPAVDMDNAVTIDPQQETMVMTEAIPMAGLAVAAGTLEDGDGNLFDQQVSITAVPPELTPAALPDGLQPDLVVTIQPAELLFTTPAPLSLPNTFGYAPGEMLDLWSINPASGEFEKVGQGQVSADGEVIETVQGGVRTSSWHFFGPPPPPPDDFEDPEDNDRNKDDGDQECEDCTDLSSVVMLHSGAVIEAHELVSYQSQGVTRGLQLVYDSLRTDPRPILHFGYQRVQADPRRMLVARMTVFQGDQRFQVPGYELHEPADTDFHTQQFQRNYGDFYFGGETETYTISATAGQSAVFERLKQYDTYCKYDDNGNPISCGTSERYWGYSVSIISPSGETVYENENGFDRVLEAFVFPETGDYTIEVDPHTRSFGFRLNDITDKGLLGGEHFFNIPPNGGKVDAAIAADMRTLPSGRYDYLLSTGLRRFSTGGLLGTSSSRTGEVVHVNSIDSPFGTGWGLAGWQQLIENADGSVLLVDGDGTELIFEPPAEMGAPYVSPVGDFSELRKLEDGTFARVFKDQTRHAFTSTHKLHTITDRNGNVTEFQYDTEGQLTAIVDPVGLTTSFEYTDGKITSIIDPAQRVTRLEYDQFGNLASITDPDQTSRTWEYDSLGHMVAEIDKRGFREETYYNHAGRAIGALRKDGSRIELEPVQSQGVYPSEQTTSLLDAPTAWPLGPAEVSYVDARGNVTRTLLDQAGQRVVSFDGEGRLPSVERNAENLVTKSTDGRGFVTLYEYDQRGNLVEVSDELSGGEVSGSFETAGEQHEYVFAGKAGQAIAVDSLATSLSQLQIQLEQTDGTLLYSSLPFSHPLELPSDGDYRLVVRRTDANLSEYGFRVVDLAQQPEIRLGEQVVGSLNPGQESDFYRFQGQTGDRVLWQHVSSTTSSGSLVLYAPDGQILSSDSSLQSDLFAELIMDGEYVVVVNGNSGTSVDYAYDLRTTQSQIRALPLNQAATFTVAGVGQELLLAFYAQKDQLVSLQSDSLYSFDVQVRFADGSQRANIYAEQVFSAPTTGIHVFSLMPQYSWLSDVTVELVASSTEVLVPGDTLHGDLGANYSAAIFPLAVNSGDLVSFSTPQSGGMSLTVLEKDADGDVYSTYSSYSGNVVFQAEAGSQYWVEMTGVGPFSVPSALVQPETLPIILDQDVRAALPSGGEWKVFTFDANAGQTVFLEDRTHPTENWYYGQRLPWRLTSPTGADLTDQMVGGDPEDGFWFAQPATLTETGQYSLEYKLTASAEHAQVDFALHTLSGLPTVALEEATNVTFESAAPDGDTLYPHAFFQVDLDAFDLVQLELLGDAGGTPITWQLFGPDQLPLVQNWLQPSESVISLESGSHLLVLSTPLSDSLATVSFRLHAPAVNVQSANLNELITLQFDEPDKSFLLEIGGTDGQRVVFLPVVEDYWNYRYTLISPSGSVDLNPSYYAVRPFTLTETGTYRLAVSRVNPSGATSQLQFELRDVAQAIELQDGGSYAFTLALGDSAELYRFQGATGRELLIAGGVTTTDSGYLELTIYGSNDDVTHAQYVYGSDDIQLGGSFNDAGDYLLVVRAGVPSETYHVAFDVDEVLLMSEPLPLNQVVKPPSPYPGMLRTYTFDGNAGSRFLFDDRNQLRYGNTMARLFAPDGSDVTSLMLEEVVESSYWSYFVPHPFQLPQDGEYTLEVSVEYLPNEGFAFGMYDLAELSPLALGQVPPDDENIHRVSGQAGQTLLLDNLPTAQNDYYYYYGHLSEWSLLTADGTVVAESREDTDGWLVLPETGDYFLRHWSEYNNGERAVAFRLLDVADAPPLTIGSETTAEFTRGGQTEIFKLESDDTDVLQFGGADAADAAVSMTLITADGQVQAGTASSLAPFLATISPPGTEYLLVAAPYSLGSTRVPFEVSQAAVDGNVSLDTLQTVSLDAQHPRRRLTLNGTAGQWLQFTNSSATDTTSGNWALSDHTGAVLAGHLPLGDSFMVALPSDGEYFLDVWQASDAADNDVQFLITDLRGTTLATVGALASLTLDMDSPSAYYRLQGGSRSAPLAGCGFRLGLGVELVLV